MLRVNHILFPAILLGCALVVILTGLLSHSHKAGAAITPLLKVTQTADKITRPGTARKALSPASTPVPSKKKKTEKPKESSSTQADSSQAKDTPDCILSSQFPDSIRQWCSGIVNAAQDQNLDANLIAAVMLQESGGDPQAYSSSGAVGLMQIMPRDGLAASFFCGDSPCFASRPSMAELYDPEFNLNYGANMLGSLYRKYGDWRDALMAYGPANVGYYYADIVLGIYQNYQ
jgi:hypothetical protein